MPAVREVTALYESFMLAPVRGPGVCRTCLTFTDGYSECYACANHPRWLDAIAPISYSVAHEQLHHALLSYKRLPGEAGRRLQIELAAVLWRFLETHERCLALEAGVREFDLVTTVPSTSAEPDDEHPLARIVSSLCGPTRERYEAVLARSPAPTREHDFDAEKFQATRMLPRPAVLLVDDTWTTGASAQSAAAALKRGGARTVAAVVIGRHLKRDWRENDSRIHRLSRPFDWETCVHCGSASIDSAPVWHRQ
jgi:predicted amidophosphoribosyltransferase